MSGRESAAVERAVIAVVAGASVSASARAHGCNVSSVRRAMRRRGLPGGTAGTPGVPGAHSDPPEPAGSGQCTPCAAV